MPLEYENTPIVPPIWPEELVVINKPEPDNPIINPDPSTVDVNIPKTKEKNENTFALIIANEKYTKPGISQVPFAENDGKSFKKYCESVLGVKEDHIVSVFNATFGEMKDAIVEIQEWEKAYDNMKLLVYYSGHGQPDPRSKEAYLLPVDASQRSMSASIKLSEFYRDLLAYNPASVTVFLDACFSGANKEGQIMDKEARGVIIKPREVAPASNMVIFAACSGDETAYPYRYQKHGLFTYFLLKKLQEDKGKTTYKQLSEYIKKNVRENSMTLYKKLQNPDIRCALPESEWGDWRLDK